VQAPHELERRIDRESLGEFLERRAGAAEINEEAREGGARGIRRHVLLSLFHCGIETVDGGQKLIRKGAHRPIDGDLRDHKIFKRLPCDPELPRVLKLRLCRREPAAEAIALGWVRNQQNEPPFKDREIGCELSWTELGIGIFESGRGSSKTRGIETGRTRSAAGIKGK
jgi:hypothetical protein